MFHRPFRGRPFCWWIQQTLSIRAKSARQQACSTQADSWLSGSTVSSESPCQVSRKDKRQRPSLVGRSQFPGHIIHHWTCGIFGVRIIDRSSPSLSRHLRYVSDVVYLVSFCPPYSGLIISFCVHYVFCWSPTGSQTWSAIENREEWGEDSSDRM